MISMGYGIWRRALLACGIGLGAVSGGLAGSGPAAADEVEVLETLGRWQLGIVVQAEGRRLCYAGMKTQKGVVFQYSLTSWHDVPVITIHSADWSYPAGEILDIRFYLGAREQPATVKVNPRGNGFVLPLRTKDGARGRPQDKVLQAFSSGTLVHLFDEDGKQSLEAFDMSGFERALDAVERCYDERIATPG